MNYNRIMLFGLPGSGKSTFSIGLAKSLNLPVYHLDKHFFVHGWVERNKDEFLQIQRKIVNQEQWIIDGNALGSLELRYARANLALYFCPPRPLCLSRLIRRRFFKDKSIDDRAVGCRERLPFHLIRYMWTFDSKVSPLLKRLHASNPKTTSYKIENSLDLANAYKLIQSRN